MIVLYDIIERKEVGRYEHPETAIKNVGAVMSYFGIDKCSGRYLVAREADKDGMAELVYNSDETWKRAQLYFDEAIFDRIPK